MLLGHVRWQKQPAMSRLASNRTVTHIRLHAWNCAHLPCTPASTKEPKSGDKTSLHLCDSSMDLCVVFTEAVFGHFIQDNSDAAQWEMHKVLLHCDEPCNFLAHPIRRGSRSLATRIPCNLCKFGVHPGHSPVNSILGSGGAMPDLGTYSQLAPASEQAFNSGFRANMCLSLTSPPGTSAQFWTAPAPGRTCTRGWHHPLARVRNSGWHRPLERARHSGWHRPLGASTSLWVASAAGRTCTRGWHCPSGRVRHSGWHRPLGDEHALVVGIRHWNGYVIFNLQIEVEGKTSSFWEIRMIFRLKSRSWLRENAAARGDGDVRDHGGECVRAITPRLRIRHTHSPALAVEIGVAGHVAVVRGGITSVSIFMEVQMKGNW